MFYTPGKKRMMLLAVLVIVIGLGVVLLPVEEAAADDDRLVVGIPGEPGNLDPQQTVTIYNFVHDMLFAAPMSMGLENDEVLPHGAAEVEPADDLSYIEVTLDPEWQFHSGRNLTAEAFADSLARRIEKSPYAFDWDPLAEKHVDGNTVVLELEEPSPGIYVNMQTSYDGPVDVEAAEEMGADDFDREPIGSGPFKFEEWVEGSHIDMTRFDDYQDSLPFAENNEAFNFSEYRVRFIPEDFTRVEELQAGGVDIIEDVPVEMLPLLEEAPEIEVIEYLEETVAYLDINHTVEPFDDYSVRAALAYAVDREELEMGLDEVIEPVFSIVGPAMMRHHEPTEEMLSQDHHHNPELATELLEEAGWEEDEDGYMTKDGERLEFEMMVDSEHPVERRSGPIMQAQLEEVGMDVSLREYEKAYIDDMQEQGDFEVILNNWTWLDPGGIWPQNLTEGGDYAPWTPTRADDLIAEAGVEPDEERGAEIWGEVSEKVWEDKGIVPLWSNYQYLAHRDNVSGLIVSENGRPYLNDVELE
ncbi:ABC transporter substrate-binding protein [Halarsenatibacter silvermanii]|uniref:ABC transporter substrate-binding protein n=1 Tax=Halarsenatibacter silvermanii TaxID=321763 RepID=UPI0013564763|nr:ABC transporter substrate-binding protein [Halarsenatibacter silvermanii]